MLKTLNAIFIALLLSIGVSGCQKQAETQTTPTPPEASTTAPAPSASATPTPPASSSAPAEKPTSTTPAHSTSKEAPKVIVVPEQQKNNTVGEAAAVHRAVAAPLRRAIGAERYIQTHPPESQ
ncbi:MAG TPA: hypothetical protein VHE99_08305 [Gammaproteobacteria bacterium]|nr:hypothetical protein [Gammaproteobacteria bacterium]